MGDKLGILGPLSVPLVIGFADFVAGWDTEAQAGFVPVYAPSDGDSIETVRVKALNDPFSSDFTGLAFTEGNGSAPNVGDQLGGQTWDLSHVDTVGTGITYVGMAGANPAIADNGQFWPVLIVDASLSGAIGLLLVNFNPGSPDPPDAGSVTIEVVYRPAA